MMVLVFFGMAWLLVALEGFRRKTGAVIAVGGGFIVACLSLFPVVYIGKYLYEEKAPQVVRQAPAAPVVQAKGLVVGYDQLLAALGPYAPDLKPAPTTADGRTRLLGRTQGGSTGVLEVSGHSLDAEVEKATLAFSAQLNDEQVNALNRQMATRYVQALFPEWVSPGTWLESNALTTPETKAVEREGRRITVKHSKELNSWFLTVEKI